jgi:hypothetical protein
MYESCTVLHFRIHCCPLYTANHALHAACKSSCNNSFDGGSIPRVICSATVCSNIYIVPLTALALQHAA